MYQWTMYGFCARSGPLWPIRSQYTRPFFPSHSHRNIRILRWIKSGSLPYGYHSNGTYTYPINHCIVFHTQATGVALHSTHVIINPRIIWTAFAACNISISSTIGIATISKLILLYYVHFWINSVSSFQPGASVCSAVWPIPILFKWITDIYVCATFCDYDMVDLGQGRKCTEAYTHTQPLGSGTHSRI